MPPPITITRDLAVPTGGGFGVGVGVGFVRGFFLSSAQAKGVAAASKMPLVESKWRLSMMILQMIV